jgi:hypothetical protein
MNCAVHTHAYHCSSRPKAQGGSTCTAPQPKPTCTAEGKLPRPSLGSNCRAHLHQQKIHTAYLLRAEQALTCGTTTASDQYRRPSSSMNHSGCRFCCSNLKALVGKKIAGHADCKDNAAKCRLPGYQPGPRQCCSSRDNATGWVLLVTSNWSSKNTVPLNAHHHHVTQSSHSINAIGPAPLWSGRKREHCHSM